MRLINKDSTVRCGVYFPTADCNLSLRWWSPGGGLTRKDNLWIWLRYSPSLPIHGPCWSVDHDAMPSLSWFTQLLSTAYDELIPQWWRAAIADLSIQPSVQAYHPVVIVVLWLLHWAHTKRGSLVNMVNQSLSVSSELVSLLTKSRHLFQDQYTVTMTWVIILDHVEMSSWWSATSIDLLHIHISCISRRWDSQRGSRCQFAMSWLRKV